MAEYSTQHNGEIQDGPSYKIYRRHLIDNFDALNSAIGDRLRVTTGGDPQTVADAVTCSAGWTFNSGILTNTISERTAASGVTADSVLLKDGVVVGWEKFRGSAPPVYASASTFTVAHIHEVDSGLAGIIRKTTSTTVDISTSGLNGLDTGAEANSTWYYLYAIAKAAGADPGLILSVTNESDSGSITLPADYVLKKQLPFVIRNDASSNILPFRIEAGWPTRPLIVWVNADDSASYRVLNAGTATTAFSNPGGGTNVSLSTYVPPVSRAAILKGVGNYTAGNGLGYVKDPGSASTTGEVFANQNSTTSNQNYKAIVGTDSSQNVTYRVSNAGTNLTLYCYGCLITEIN